MDKRLSVDRSRSVILLAAALVMTVTWAVGATGWTTGLNIVTFVGVGSIIIGLMLARSLLPGAIAHVFSIVIGISWSFWVTSRLLPDHYTWHDRWQNLVSRLDYWYNQAIQGGTSYDNMMFILQMGVIVWGMGYLTIWFLFRSGKVWQAIVPGGLVLLINLYYAPNDITMWFLVFLLLSLLLAIRFNLFKQEAQWRAEGVFFRPDISFDFLRDGFIFSALVIALAWLMPPIASARSLGLLDEFQGSWSEVQGEWNRMFADLNYKDAGVDGFSTSLNLGGPRRLTNEPVMNVKVEGQGRYWRATVYDEYTGFGWRNNDDYSAGFGPGNTLSLPVFEARVPVTQTYVFYHDQATVLYAMGDVIGLDRSAKVTFNALSGEQIAQVDRPVWPNNGEPWVEDITYIRSNAAVDSGESYQVVSAASQTSISQLQAAGTDYPDWVTARYLQLPEAVTERTRTLAHELADPFDTPYDKTRAIESYLRREIEYNEKIAAPPPGVDRVDYILFNTKEAYCDYYASAMIVMLRSLGIPARFAVGFAQGTFDAELDAYHVVNADAHAWVEVYFPGYGWIEFEPTSSQPGIVRPVEPVNSAGGPFSPNTPGGIPGPRELPERPNEDLLEQGADVSSLPFTFNIPWVGAQISVSRSVVNWGSIAIGVILAAALAAGAFWWQRQTKPVGDFLKLYERMVQLATWMGAAVRPWQTPYEHAALLQRRLPSRQQEIELITDGYVRQLFSPAPVAPPESRAGAATTMVYESDLAWRRLHPEMIKAVFKRHLPKWARFKNPMS